MIAHRKHILMAAACCAALVLGLSSNSDDSWFERVTEGLFLALGAAGILKTYADAEVPDRRNAHVGALLGLLLALPWYLLTPPDVRGLPLIIEPLIFGCGGLVAGLYWRRASPRWVALGALLGALACPLLMLVARNGLLLSEGAGAMAGLAISGAVLGALIGLWRSVVRSKGR